MNRREFFVKSAKAVIPITGAALLIANPAIAKVLEQAGDGSKLPQGTLPYSFNGFNERVQAYIVARYYVRLSTSFGHQGRETFKLATRIYAEQRGHRMAQRALADGQELTVATYHQYGEWVPTEESKQRGESLDQEVLWDRPYYAFKVKRCPWAIQFREMGLPEAGLAYCKDLDASIYRGFNPTIKYETRQTLHDHDCCIQCSPGMDRGSSRFIGRLAVSYAYEHGGWAIAVGTGYGTRAPTVTESYGYFLNNTFDQYDYIGNPYLRNEKAIEVNASVGFENRWVSVKAETNAFFFQDYIIGRPDSRLSPMTIGAAGVKVYQNLKDAQIVNTSLTADCRLNRWLQLENRLAFSYGKESSGARLPLIAPLSYLGSLRFSWKYLETEGGVKMASRNSHCGTEYGETPTAGYAVWHLYIGGQLRLGQVIANLHLGIENLFDRYYATYSDWNHIPQKGRNIYVNTSFQF